MLTANDILILILLVGSGIFIWVVRNSSSDHRTDKSIAHDLEIPPSAEQKETHDETNELAGHGKSKKEDAQCNCK
jgi:hypothetical protein